MTQRGKREWATYHTKCELLVWRDLLGRYGGDLWERREGEGNRGVGHSVKGTGGEGVLAGGTGGGALWSGSVPGTTTLSWK